MGGLFLGVWGGVLFGGPRGDTVFQGDRSRTRATSELSSTLRGVNQDAKVADIPRLPREHLQTTKNNERYTMKK